MIKISFSGISGSGKTSLLNEVKKVLSLKYQVVSVDEISGKNPFDADRKSSFISQFFYFTTQINEENIHAMAPADYLLCDRSILDQWIYWKSYIMAKDMTPQLEEKHRILEKLYRYWITTYDLHFLIRVDLDQMDTRDMNKEFRKISSDYVKQREKIFLDTIEEDKVKVFEIWNNNTVDESAHRIIQIISENVTAPESSE